MGKFSVLAKADLTEHWSLEEHSALAHFLKTHRAAEGELILTSDQNASGLFFIETGKIQLKEESLSRELHPGETFGETAILRAGSKNPSALALEETLLWQLDFENWQELRKIAPSVSLKLAESIVQKLANRLNSSPASLGK